MFNFVEKYGFQHYFMYLGALRTEKVELSAQVKKQQARILYLDDMVDKLSKEVCSYTFSTFCFRKQSKTLIIKLIISLLLSVKCEIKLLLLTFHLE